MDKSRSKSQIVYEYINGKILSGVYPPGYRIPSEAALCKKLSVSRVSVRSGVEKLIAIGLLKKQKNGSTFVSKPDDSNYLKSMTPTLIHNIDYIEMLEFRQALDTLSVSLCIKNIDEQGIKKMRDMLTEMEELKEDDSFFDIDRKFHLLISKYSDNRLLININEIIWDVLEHSGRSSYHDIDNTQRIIEHKMILDAIINKDPDLAYIYTSRHLGRTISDLKKNN